MLNQWVIFGLVILLIALGAMWVYRAHPRRDSVIFRAAVVSATSAGASIIVAIFLETVGCRYKDRWGLPLLATWVVAPPLWFFFEYFIWPPPAAEDERTRHFHDLARNLWLALVVLLAAIMEIKFPGAE